MQNEVARVRHRTRTILGTNHPVETVVTREGPRQWRTTYYLCDGVPNGSVDYRTRRQAILGMQTAWEVDHD